ncbi:rhamnogalacturonan lyase family protein [Wenyingzhuangia sp. IMCC45467]
MKNKLLFKWMYSVLGQMIFKKTVLLTLFVVMQQGLFAQEVIAEDVGGKYSKTVSLSSDVVTSPKQMEYLDRGLIATQKASNQVFLSWRLLGTDPSNIAFNVYRGNVKVNTDPITNSTNFIDFTSGGVAVYTVKPMIDGVEGEASKAVAVWEDNQITIPLQIPPGNTTAPGDHQEESGWVYYPEGLDYTYTANDASVGDMDGDGEYEIVLKWSPTVVNHNAGGINGQQIFDCYRLDGTLLWRINLGNNVNSGPHMNQFAVYDFDGDGKAEVALRTADGTVDGVGNVIGDPNADYRNRSGWIQEGPAWLTIFNGITGAAMASVPYEPNRGHKDDWRDGGNGYGNRQDRLLMAVAYLDGEKPSIITGRGYYAKLVRAAYDWRDGELTLRWIFDSKDPSNPGNNAASGQGNHQLTIGDVDGDGKDEIINGSSAIDDDGTLLWSNGNGHGDALHMSDMDPDRPGLEIWLPLECPSCYDGQGIRLLDAKTGETIYGVETTGDVGRGLASDVDPDHKGYEMWASSGNFYNVQEGEIGTEKPTGGIMGVNSAVWWDGDLGRELLDRQVIEKWISNTQSRSRLWTIYNDYPVTTNNSTKSNAALSGDLFGDWREEIMFRRSDNTALVIVTTDILTEHRIPTLMHDPMYRVAIAWQNNDYNQPPHPGYYLGYDMEGVPASNIMINKAENLAPTAVADEVTVAEGGSTSSLVGGARSLLDNDTDPEKNKLTAELVTDVTNGTLTLNADGTFTYVHDGSSNSITDSFTYKVTDGVSYSNIATVSISASEISIPYDNFTIRTASETCADHDNGTLTINAVQTHSYVANLNGTDYSFDGNTLIVSDLAPGTYPVCITITGKDYEQCFSITIDEAEILLGSSKVSINELDMEIEEGTAPYKVFVNGVSKLETSSKNFTMSVKQGDLVEVKTAKPCEGTYTEKILNASEYVSASPNPTNKGTEITVPTKLSEVSVELYSAQGQQVLKGLYSVVNQKVQLDIENEASGVYLARILAETPLSLTIIKK